MKHGELHGYVRAFSSDTHDTREKENADPLSIPLVNDKGAPLVAMLDTNTINRKIKSYIQTLMRNMIQNSMQEHMRGIFKSSLEEDATIDFIKNITLQEINDALNQQVQEGIYNILILKSRKQISPKTKDVTITCHKEHPSCIYSTRLPFNLFLYHTLFR